MRRRTFLLLPLAALPLAALPLAALAQTTAVTAFGDSITHGNGASDIAHSYAALLGAALGWAIDNTAHGGGTIASEWPYIQASIAAISVWLVGYNDMRQGLDPDTLAAQLADAVGWLAGTGRTLYLGNCLRMADYGPSGYWGRGSDALVATYNERIAGVVADAQASGHAAYLVDACAVYDPLTMLAADGVHPDDAGHAAIAQAFLGVIRRRVLLPVVGGYPAP